MDIESTSISASVSTEAFTPTEPSQFRDISVSSEAATSSETPTESSVRLAVDSGQTCRRARPRPAWVHVWSTGTHVIANLDEFLATLPKFTRKKNDETACKLDHRSYGQHVIASHEHHMRTIMTKCSSERCNQSSTTCRCRYKIIICERNGMASVFVAGNHVMIDVEATSPSKLRLTNQMKDYLNERLSKKSSTKPHELFAVICAKVLSSEFRGPLPREEQIQDHMKRWRGRHKVDSMKSVIDICTRSMYEAVQNITEKQNDLVVFCDSLQMNDDLLPNLGDGSDESPFRIGMTCFSLLETYVMVQQDSTKTTLLHIDSTHNLVHQCYSVFIIGLSDQCGHYFPVVYFCSSQRRAADIEWCLSRLDRALSEHYSVGLRPQFIMTDADDAQYNACTSKIPSAVILMCWFYVSQNVKAKSKSLPRITRTMIFRDLNRLHFSRSAEEYGIGLASVRAAWLSASTFSPTFRVVAHHIIHEWFDNPRFSKWQVFHTSPGCAKTNNPVEQYHKNVKLVNHTPRATPIEMVYRLDQCRLAHIAKHHPFNSTTHVSRRLKALYNGIVKHKEITSQLMPPIGTQILKPVRVQHIRSQHVAPIHSSDDTCNNDRDEMEFESRALPFKSPHVLRMQWDGMPLHGWIVDAIARSCQCRFFNKYGMCVHVIHATQTTGLHCPGMPDPDRRFVSRRGRSNRGNRRRNPTANQSHANNDQVNIPEGAIYGPHLPTESSSLHSHQLGIDTEEPTLPLVSNLQETTTFDLNQESASWLYDTSFEYEPQQHLERRSYPDINARSWQSTTRISCCQTKRRKLLVNELRE